VGPRLALGALAIGAALLPRRTLEHLPIVCPVRLITGYPCPTCGMTRSWHSLAQLEPMRAVRDHPFGPLVLGAIVIGAWSQVQADAMAARVGRLPVRVKAGALLGWLGWWVSRLAVEHRRRLRSGHPWGG
jgi:uncharacterized protein DUF2752